MYSQPVDRLFFIDDSGDLNQGVWLYGYLGVAVEAEPGVRCGIEAFRVGLLVDFGIPVDYELHAHKFVVGRGRPGGRDLPPLDRKHTAQRMLDFLGEWPDLTVGAVYSQQSIRSSQLRADTFAGTLRRIDAQLSAVGEYGRLVIDGDGTDPMYEAVLADVRPARIVGLGFAPAHESQFLQFVDLVAYAAFQWVMRAPKRTFMHYWYPTHLPKAHGPERV
ncbi:hypothetical protein [Kitasatospora sp. NPDC008115]|uniref:hypothetical protein n=1 Tax=Kitasatospora sp. NPDC008115 TaxID=3364022 RepID=UPI0036ECE3BD